MKNPHGYTVIEVLFAIIVVGLIAYYLQPEAEKLQQHSAAKTALMNCRKLSLAARRYFKQTGAAQVRSDQLAGPGYGLNYWRPVARERYTSTIKRDGVVTAGPLPNGQSVKYP